MSSTPQRPARPWRSTPAPGPTNPEPDMSPEEVYFAIGRIVGAHGIRGEAKMEILTDNADQLAQLRRIYLNDDPSPVRLLGLRMHAGHALLTLEGVSDRDAAEGMRGTIVRISGGQAKPLGEGEFFHYQLIGLQVEDDHGNPLGELTEILESGEVDVYVVRDSAGHEQLFPALQDVVLEIDPSARRMVVRPQEWEPTPAPRQKPPPRSRRARKGPQSTT